MRKALFFGLVIIGLIVIGYLFRDPILDFLTPAQRSGTVSNEHKPESAYRFAVSIDNAIFARPQAGLAEADVVFETPAEGGLTRLLAFFQSGKADRIGPVRSLRPYFIHYASGFDAILVHSGGSQESLQALEGRPEIRSINEFFNSQYIIRDRESPAPHNLFTSTALLSEKAGNMDWEKTGPEYPWPLKQDSMTTAIRSSEIIVNFGNPGFSTRYEYDSNTNSYQRFIAGEKHLEVKNLVVINTTSTLLDENLLTIDLKTTGTGRATIFQGGEVIRARWRKLSREAPLQFLEADDTQIEMNIGLTWIAVLDQRGSFSWQ